MPPELVELGLPDGLVGADAVQEDDGRPVLAGPGVDHDRCGPAAVSMLAIGADRSDGAGTWQDDDSLAKRSRPPLIWHEAHSRANFCCRGFGQCVLS